MSGSSAHEFARLMGPVAIELLGKPNAGLSSVDKLRFGSRGSLSIDLTKGVFRDHETGKGGGLLDLVQDRKQLDKAGAIAWLQERGHIHAAAAPKQVIKRRQVATYDYLSPDGTLLFQVCRYEPKDFRQRTPDGTGGWTWTTAGVQRVLYRLPRIITAVAADRTIFITEGEKGVHALESLGLVGTCPPGGAGKWLPEYGKFLVGADVVILADNDPQATMPDGTPRWHQDGRPVLPGQDHAADVARHLHGAAAKVRVLMLPGLPSKGDIADWISAGGTAAKLAALARLADSDPPPASADREHDINGRRKKSEPDQDAEEEPPPQPRRNRPRSIDPGDFVWPTPLDFLTDPQAEAPELRHEHIPPAINDFVFDTAQRMGVDPTSVALACIGSCAAVVSDDWEVQPKRHDYTWTEKPRLWGDILGGPSIKKTPVINACTAPIDKLDAAARNRHAEAMRDYRQQMKIAKADKTGATPEPTHPKLDRYLVEGATVEAISEVLRDDDDAHQRAPAHKVLVRQDEMSEFFANLDRYRTGGNGGGDRGAYLRLFNGGPYSIDRIGRGSFNIPNWSAGFLGGMQPGPIQNIAKNATEDGLLQRFLYAVPGPQDVKGVDRAPSIPARAQYSALFPALTALHPPRTPDGKHIQAVVFHADAHQHREAVDTMAEIMALMPDTSIHLQSAYGKWPGLFARIALTFHLIEIADARATNNIGPILGVISEQTARRAAAFMLEITLPHLLRAHRLMFSTTQTGHAQWIAGFILSEGCKQITSRDVVRVYRALKAPEAKDELAAVMANLVTIGWLEPVTPTNLMKPVSTWVVNPAVHVLFADRAEREQAQREKARKDLAANFEALKRKRVGTDTF